MIASFSGRVCEQIAGVPIFQKFTHPVGTLRPEVQKGEKEEGEAGGPNFGASRFKKVAEKAQPSVRVRAANLRCWRTLHRHTEVFAT